MTTLAEPAPHREVRLSRWRLGLLAGASLLAPAVQVVQLVRREHTEDLVTAVASMVLFGLVLARLQGLAGEVAALAAGWPAPTWTAGGSCSAPWRTTSVARSARFGG